MDDELDKALAKIRGIPATDPMEEALSRIRRQAPSAHNVGLRERQAARGKISDREEANAESVSVPRAMLHSVLATGANLAQGIPGMERAQAGARSLVRGQSYDDALSDVRGQTDKIPEGLKTGERIAGAIPLLGIPGASSLSAPVAGALLGGADQALSADHMSATQRALQTAGGAAAGALLPKVGRGLANVAQRTGLTDALGSGIRQIGEDAAMTPGLRKIGSAISGVGEAMGTRGAGNALLADRQAILDKLSGSEQSAANTMLDHVDAYKQQAKALYATAKQDQSVVNHPRVQSALADPRVQQMLDMARARLGGSPNETVIAEAIPGKVGEVPPPSALSARTEAGRVRGNLANISDDDLDKEINRLAERQSVDGGFTDAHFEHPDTQAAQELVGGGHREDARELMPSRHQEASMVRAQFEQRAKTLAKLQAEQARRETVMREAERGGGSSGDTSFGFGENAVSRPEVPAVTMDLPTPEELAMTKRILSAVVQQKFNAPQGINSAEAAQMAPLLDNLRAGLHEASPAWKDADAFYSHAKNFEDAFHKAYGAQQKPTASGLTPTKLKTPEAIGAWVDKAQGTPVGIARASGQQAGAAGRLGEAVRNAPLGTSINETLGNANGVFQPSASSAAIRRPAFGNDEAASDFSALLGNVQRKGAMQSEGFGPQSVPGNPLKWLQALTPQNRLATPQGVELRTLLADALSDPRKAAALRAQIASSQDGSNLLQSILRGSLVAGNASSQR